MVKEAVFLGKLIKKAIGLAEYFYSDMDDAGSSNLDSCVIELKVPNKVFVEIITEVSGVNLLERCKGNYQILIKYASQANRRTKIAEFVCQHLKNAGVKSFVEYTLD